MESTCPLDLDAQKLSPKCRLDDKEGRAALVLPSKTAVSISKMQESFSHASAFYYLKLYH
jgi:hypothetical protein